MFLGFRNASEAKNLIVLIVLIVLPPLLNLNYHFVSVCVIEYQFVSKCVSLYSHLRLMSTLLSIPEYSQCT
jgi:hypothetical protein